MDSLNALEEEFAEQEKLLQERLLKQLSAGEKMSSLTAAPEWEYYVSSLQKTIERNKKVIVSDKFINDHNGYLFLAAQTLTLERLIGNIDRIRKQYENAAKQLNELEEQQNG